MDASDAQRLRVLFVCTRNSARSQMAEALLRHLRGGRIDVFSAGSEPGEFIHPLVGEAVSELMRANLTDAHPKPLSPFSGERFDYVITLCDSAAEQFPSFPGRRESTGGFGSRGGDYGGTGQGVPADRGGDPGPPQVVALASSRRQTTVKAFRPVVF